MAQSFLTDFGFHPQGEIKGFEDINYGPRKKRKKLLWTLYVYIALSLGIFLRNIVNYPDAKKGLDTASFKAGIVAASFIIGLALLSPLLRYISKINKGKLSWEHCLSSFTIGFFGNLAFQLLLNRFFKLI